MILRLALSPVGIATGILTWIIPGHNPLWALALSVIGYAGSRLAFSVAVFLVKILDEIGL